MIPDFLYRGFHVVDDDLNFSLDLTLTPKNPILPPEMAVECVDSSELESGAIIPQCGDSDFQCGSNIGNAIHFHEYGRNGADTGYLSFTPHFKRAKAYATHDGTFSEGKVLKISTRILLNKNFKIISVKENIQIPSCIEDDEYSIYVGENEFPKEAILEIFDVTV